MSRQRFDDGDGRCSMRFYGCWGSGLAGRFDDWRLPGSAIAISGEVDAERAGGGGIGFDVDGSAGRC